MQPGCEVLVFNTRRVKQETLPDAQQHKLPLFPSEKGQEPTAESNSMASPPAAEATISHP